MTEQKPSTESVLGKIKSRGYWEVIIRPKQFEKERLSLPKCLSFVETCKVVLRGWDYPHISRKLPPRVAGVDYVESLEDWNGYKEIWRMYQSGQFVHLFGCREDWLAEHVPIFGPSRYSSIKPGTILEVIMTLYCVTEIYEFAMRLAQKNLFDQAVFLSITLHGMKNRSLAFLEAGRFLDQEYACDVNDLKKENIIAIGELLGRGHEMSLNDTIWVLQHFNWLEPSKEILKEDQKKFLEGKFA